MRVVDAIRFRQIQVMRLHNEGLTSREIINYLNRVNPKKFALTRSVKSPFSFLNPFKIKSYFLDNPFYIQNARQIVHRNTISYLKEISQKFSWRNRIKVTDTLIHFIHVRKI